ncbi:MAG TPA: acyltransferase [Bryobacteraceae bacterium]|nr:acyltransferase [Bryobacteraceae bacterium]
MNCTMDVARAAAGTGMARVLAWWWGIEVGPESRFYGLPLFRRLPGTSIRIGPNCQFRSAKWSNLIGVNRPCILATLVGGAAVRIGSACGFTGTAIGCASRIVIGDRVMCGANVTITDTDWHPIDWRDRISGKTAEASPVVIGDDVWLGVNVIVLKGVEIGEKTVVGAGSIVTRSLPAGVIAAGQPAKVIRELRGRTVSSRP